MVELEGYIESIIFHSEDSGFAVCHLMYNSQKIVVVGNMPFINVGETLKIQGQWVKHPSYGEQLKVEFFEKSMPTSKEGIVNYLSSGIVKGIGVATARKIVRKFGIDSLDIIINEPFRLMEIKGINQEKAEYIGDTISKQNIYSELLNFFRNYGLSSIITLKVYKVYSENSLKRIKVDPYLLVKKDFGVSFKNADKMALSLGIEEYSDQRVKSGILYSLNIASYNGHTFLHEDHLIRHSSSILELDEETIKYGIISLLLKKELIQEKVLGESRIYLSEFYEMELEICKKIFELSSIESKMMTLDKLNKRISRYEVNENIQLAENQKKAVIEAVNSSILIITGGPGTGKTTIIKSIINIMKSIKLKVVLAAPTGKAAKRMTEATGIEAKTIHRLLEIVVNDEEKFYTRDSSKPIEADVIIVDEASMIDIILMSSLMEAIELGTKIIIVGDVNQLPSVGPGIVLKDLIKSDQIKTITLFDIFRQAQESMIINNAHKIMHGEYPILNLKEKDFFFIQTKSDEELNDTIISLISNRLSKTYGFDAIQDIQVLTPSKKGAAGVSTLNNNIQKVLNPELYSKNQHNYISYTFREGDKVMQTKNNYTINWMKIGNEKICGEGIFNGDSGFISEVDNKNECITIIFDDDKQVIYDFSNLDEIELSYAITIHKSQGSEFPVVILPLWDFSRLLMTRNLLYTAITRAKNLVVVVGSLDIMKRMIDNGEEQKRYSGLSEKIKLYFKGIIE